MEYKIIINNPSGESKEYYLGKQNTKIGRASANDIVLSDKFYTVSRFHCEIEINNDEILLRDLGSKNGTFVNNEKIIVKKIYPNDIIKIGAFTFVLKKGETFQQTTIEDESDYTIVKDVKELENYWEKPDAKTDFLKPLIEIAKILLESRKLNYILETTTNFMFKYIRPERVFIFLKDDEELILKFKKTFIEEKDEKSIISRTIINEAFKNRVSVLSVDTKDDMRFQDAESVILGGIKSVICVPMFYKENIYGVIYMDRIKSNSMFNEKNLEFVTVVSNYISIAIQQSNLQQELEDEKNIRSKLEKYHSPSVVNKIMSETDIENIFDFNEGEATVMFIDIVGFTSLSERLGAIKTGEFLNKFFSETTDIIFSHKGTLDKYIGDAVMAIYGMPIQFEEHKKEALLSALEIMAKIEELNSLNLLPDIKIRIGISSGQVISGNFGSMKRMEYTVIGQTVNLASRLEEKIASENEIIVNKTIYLSCKKEFEFEPLGEKEISGFSKKIEVFKLIGGKE